MNKWGAGENRDGNEDEEIWHKLIEESNAEKEMNHFLATFLSIKIDKVPKSEEKYAIKIQKLEEIRNWNKEQMLIEQEQDRKDKECEAASISKENQSDD